MSMRQDDAIAIVGFGGVLPGSTDLDGFWANVVSGVDATRDVPPGRWLLTVSQAFDQTIPRIDKVYAKRGGFVEDFRPDFGGLHLDASLLERLDPVFHLAVHAAQQAWRSA